ARAIRWLAAGWNVMGLETRHFRPVKQKQSCTPGSSSGGKKVPSVIYKRKLNERNSSNLASTLDLFTQPAQRGTHCIDHGAQASVLPDVLCLGPLDLLIQADNTRFYLRVNLKVCGKDRERVYPEFVLCFMAT